MVFLQPEAGVVASRSASAAASDAPVAPLPSSLREMSIFSWSTSAQQQQFKQ